ncbi:unnamed protein product [Heligmosomoides polygyrus]|uniref:BESS domain-containing protein n=1 Tax=Heligmosomoides polygyrus TaxID=6339 RepID=A0A183G4M2_HELPZ|nr:unnamed protein product [Heligmosomoides polygyrus]
MAEEVVMEGDYVEEYIDEPMHEDDMAESLVALSRSGEYSEKTEGVEYVVDTIETKRKQPRILRRFAHQQQQQFAEQPQGYVDSRQILVDDYQPVASAGRDTRFTPKFPVAVARRGLTQSIRSSTKSDWREDQCKKLLVCDVLESLPDHKQNAFKKLMDLMGVNVPGHQPSPKRKYAETSPGYYPDVESGEAVTARQSQKGNRYGEYFIYLFIYLFKGVSYNTRG